MSLFALRRLRRRRPIPKTSDALQQRIVEELSVFGKWCRNNGVRGYVGEYATPNDSKRAHVTADQERWLVLLRKWYATANHFGLWGTAWNSSVLNFAVDTTIWLNVYTPPQDGTGSKTLSKSYAQAPIVESNTAIPGLMRGVNIAGGEYEQTGFNNTALGTYDTDYRYPDAGSYSFIYSKGHRIVRLPFRWERLQPTLGGALDATEVARLKTSLDGAQAAGIKVILDCHNYARYITSTGTLVMGDGTLTNAHLNDFWTKMVTEFNAHAAVWAYDIMNEPHTLVNSAAQWQTASQEALTAIRNAGSTKFIMVPGYNWSAARVWTTNHPSPWITDPSNKFMYECHMYFDDGNNGTFLDNYDTTLTAATNRGYVAKP